MRAGATDVHIESYSNDVDLRFYRIDGVMHHRQTPLSPANLPHVLNYLKVLCGLDITERRHAQDGRIETFYFNENQKSRRIDLRTAFCPGPWGEDVVLRILDERRIDMKLEQLGMPDAVAEPYRQALHRPSGVLLVTGPTGSGKTTTLYASIRAINTPENKILSVEDPIEYVLPKVNQKERTGHMDFSDFGRAFMRQNPDVLMIGEIRDAETAQVVLQAAQTGHLVLSTLHTLRAASAVERLMTLGSDPGLAASALLGILNQRLVRRVCATCAEPYSPDPEVLERLPAMPSGASFRHGIGCAECHQTGYRGMVGVFEFLPMHAARREVLRMNGRLGLEDLLDCPLWDDAMHKVAQGATTAEEILRVLSVPDF